MTTVKQLRRILENALERIEGLDDELELEERANTYGIETPYIETYTGFIELNDIRIERR